MSEEVDVVVRCRNEMPYARRTLEGLFAQRGLIPRVLFLDCASTDGSREEAEQRGATVHAIVPREYIPGAVLNLGMRMTRSARVAFINADAIPLEPEALSALLAPLDKPGVAASFARQVARPDADALTRADYDRAFASGPVAMRHGVFFSMAASALRREVWSALPFDETLRYSEDADWTQRAAALGWQIEYVPGARFEHSHAYDLAGQLKRRAGEGRADTEIFHLGAPSPVRELLIPLAGSLVRDLRAGVLGPRATAIRAVQSLGRYQGRRASEATPAGLKSTAVDERETEKSTTGDLRQHPAKSTGVDTRAERLTLGGDPSAERSIGALLETVAERVRTALGAELRTLALVGSYARGEGGAVARPGQAALGPYNDLDLIAVVPRGAAGWRRKLHPLCAAWSQELGCDVDVWAVDEALVAQPPRTLFWLDIALGGFRVLRGDRSAFERLALRPRQIPLDEAGRLLANRAVGIALSNLEGGDEPMARHIHKSALACGDALLLAADRYRPHLRERLVELERLQDAPHVGARLVARYADALTYRARPDRWDPKQPRAAWYAEARAEIAGWHFSFEAFRRHAPGSPAAFATWPGRIYTALPDVRPLGGLLASVRAAATGSFPLFPFLGHPRERLARAAVALAYGDGDPASREAACTLLGVPTKIADAMLALKLRSLAGRAG